MAELRTLRNTGHFQSSAFIGRKKKWTRTVVLLGGRRSCKVDATCVSFCSWQIDQLVYELYGLTADEIKVVEEGTGK